MTHGTPVPPLTIGQMAGLAVLMEVTAAKPGNVHRGADFEDVSFFEFAAAAQGIIPAVERVAQGASLGECLLAAVNTTRNLVGTNTNLGTLLLILPLAAVRDSDSLESGVRQVLGSLTAEDARLTYAAISQAVAGGLGKVPESDITGPPPPDLIAAMRLAEDRDMVARQYARGFADLFDVVVPLLRADLQRGWALSPTIIHAQISLMAKFPDSLIARKCGPAVAAKSAAYAQQVLDAGLPGEEDYQRALADLDFWLRSDHHRRNPGTTADLLAAGLFIALRTGLIQPPFRFYARTP